MEEKYEQEIKQLLELDRLSYETEKVHNNIDDLQIEGMAADDKILDKE